MLNLESFRSNWRFGIVSNLVAADGMLRVVEVKPKSQNCKHVTIPQEGKACAAEKAQKRDNQWRWKIIKQLQIVRDVVESSNYQYNTEYSARD